MSYTVAEVRRWEKARRWAGRWWSDKEGERLAERRFVEGTQLARMHVVTLGAQQINSFNTYLQMLGDCPFIKAVGLAR